MPTTPLSADTKYAVKDVFEGAAYQFRVSAINLSGAGDPSIPCDTVTARDPMSEPITQHSCIFIQFCLLTENNTNHP